MREKIKILQNEIEILRTAVAQKDRYESSWHAMILIQKILYVMTSKRTFKIYFHRLLHLFMPVRYLESMMSKHDETYTNFSRWLTVVAIL